MQDLPRPGLRPVSPALAGGFFTTGPPERSGACLFKISKGYCMAVTENGVDLSRLVGPNLPHSVLFKKQGTVRAVCSTIAFVYYATYCLCTRFQALYRLICGYHLF